MGVGGKGFDERLGTVGGLLGALFIARPTRLGRCVGAYLVCPQFHISEESANLLFRFEYLEERRLKRTASRRYPRPAIIQRHSGLDSSP